jgi:hypothetical protein
MCVHGVRGQAVLGCCMATGHLRPTVSDGRHACAWLLHGHWPLEANTRCPSCAIVRSVFVDTTLTSLCALQTWFLCRSSWYAFGPSVSQPLMEQVRALPLRRLVRVVLCGTLCEYCG